MMVFRADVARWKLLLALEPGLVRLLRDAQAIVDDEAEPYFCANRHWYGNGQSAGLRGRLRALVGWERPDGPDELRDSLAYDLATAFVYDALPNCRNCACSQPRLAYDEHDDAWAEAARRAATGEP